MNVRSIETFLCNGPRHKGLFTPKKRVSLDRTTTNWYKVTPYLPSYHGINMLWKCLTCCLYCQTSRVKFQPNGSWFANLQNWFTWQDNVDWSYATQLWSVDISKIIWSVCLEFSSKAKTLCRKLHQIAAVSTI
jgi:hypothetical protein